jgi:hypothetical protein
MPAASITNKVLYADLRRQGDPVHEPAMLFDSAAAARGTSAVEGKGGKAVWHDDWAVRQSCKRAKEIGLSAKRNFTSRKS